MNRMGRAILLTTMRGGGRGEDGRSGYGRSEYGEGWDGRMEFGRDGYDGPDSRFRGRRGRGHYDNGRFAPMNDGGMWVDSREWDGRRDYRTPEGRFPMTTPYVPPVYQMDGGERGGQRPMNTIGFKLEGHADRSPQEFGREYRSDAGYPDMDEMAYRDGGRRMSGFSSGSGGRPFTRELAQEWVQHMRNADGTTGPHWTMEKTEEARAQRGINCDPLAFWVAMNMVYSDYSKVAEKVNANSMDFYVYMAKAFLEDKDARNQGGEKLARYYEYVVM